MATELVRVKADNIVENSLLTDPITRAYDLSEPVTRTYDLSEPVTRTYDLAEPVTRAYDLVEPVTRAYDMHQPKSNSSLEMSEISDFSRDVDNWIRGDPPMDSGVQGTSPTLATAQRSTMVPSRSLTNRIWYLAAIIMPFVSGNNDVMWRCTPSTVLNTTQLLLTHMTQGCAQVRSRLRRLIVEQATRDVFATAIDFALVIYAIGFLALSVYQAYIITH